MKVVELNIDINRAMSICLLNGIKVFPVVVGKKFKIEVDNAGKIIKGKKIYNNKDIASACSKVYKYYAQLLIQKEIDYASRAKKN